MHILHTHKTTLSYRTSCVIEVCVSQMSFNKRLANSQTRDLNEEYSAAPGFRDLCGPVKNAGKPRHLYSRFSCPVWASKTEDADPNPSRGSGRFVRTAPAKQVKDKEQLKVPREPYRGARGTPPPGPLPHPGSRARMRAQQSRRQRPLSWLLTSRARSSRQLAPS